MNTHDRGGSPRGWLEPVRGRIVSLCDRCLATSAGDGGAVALATAPNGREILYSTDATATAIEDLQLVLGEGPCVDAMQGGRPVLVEDLRDRAEGVSRRWPSFLAETSKLPVRALFVFPIQVGTIALGTFEVYRRAAGAPAPAELRSMLSTVDGVATALLDVGPVVNDATGPPAPSARTHQAAGMVMLQLGTTVEEAMVRLRATAYAEGTTLDNVASSVLDGRRRFSKEEA